ncbi:MAG TPA: hypothetical protein VF683_03450, partial [Chthoniobacterales bacterium]
GFGLKLQLDLTFDADLSAPAVERELLRALFLEMMYRAASDVPVGTAYVEPPDWLLDGTLAVSAAREPAALASALGTAVAAGNVIPLDQLLRQRPALLDSPSRELYRAYAGALIVVLTDAPEGRNRLARFVSDLPRASNDPMADLRAHFPSLGDDAEQIQVHWSAAVARLASRQGHRLLSCEESERELARLLQLEVQEGKQPPTAYAIEEYAKFVRARSAASPLKALRQQLLVLSARANPLYRPVIGEYEKIASQLARKKTGNMTERLAELRAMREHIIRRMSAVADYLNWFEATQARTASGAFQEYMKAAETTVDRERRRRDPISVYLDVVESQFH